MINFQTISKEELNQLEEKRKEQMKKLPFVEQPSTNSIINELRFNDGFFKVGPFLINEHQDKLEVDTLDSMHLFFLHYIGIHEKQKGNGTRVMKRICALADKYQYEIYLEIDETKGTPEKVLEKFYQSFGFFYTEEKPKEMVRHPKKAN